MVAKAAVFDVAVIGGGPGGYVAAIRAAQLGGRVALIEKDRVGGVCANVGCIPTKTLLHAAELIHEIRKAEGFGISVSGISIDQGRLIQRKDEVVNHLVQGIELLLKSNGVSLIKGKATILSNRRIEVARANGIKEMVEARNVIIATGTLPARPPIPGVNGKDILTSDEALGLLKIPSSIIIVGGGPEGVEFAFIFAKLGAKVTLVETLPRLLPNEDHELGPRLQQSLIRDGVKVMANTRILEVSEGDGERAVRAQSGEQEKWIQAEKVLLAVGRIPCIEELGLDRLGMLMNKGWIVVNDRMETNIPSIYAIGDVTGGAFAHEAMEEGMVAAENALGGNSVMDHRVIPRCIYTIPEVAAVGLTEEQARGKGYKVKVGRLPFTSSGRAFTMGETDGLAKVVLEAESGKLLGIHIIGSRASELITEAALAMRMTNEADSIVRTIHPHPTLSEALREAVLDADGLAIHRARVPL